MKNYFLPITLCLLLTPLTSAAMIVSSRWVKTHEGEFPLTCIICHNEKLHIYSMRRWLTFDFIISFPTSDKEYFLECLACKNCYKPIHFDIKEFLASTAKKTEIKHMSRTSKLLIFTAVLCLIAPIPMLYQQPKFV